MGPAPPSLAARRPAELPSFHLEGRAESKGPAGRVAGCASARLILTVDYISGEDSLVDPSYVSFVIETNDYSGVGKEQLLIN